MKNYELTPEEREITEKLCQVFSGRRLGVDFGFDEILVAMREDCAHPLVIYKTEECPESHRIIDQWWQCRDCEARFRSAPDRTDICPGCGGPADNGHDRCVPPNPYYCSKCDGAVGDPLAQMTIDAQERGEYDPPFRNSLVREPEEEKMCPHCDTSGRCTYVCEQVLDEDFKKHASQKALDIIASFYNILKARDEEIAALRAPKSLEKCIQAAAKVDLDDVGSALPNDNYKPYVKAVLDAAGVKYGN